MFTNALTGLQLGLIIGGAVLVVILIIYFIWYMTAKNKLIGVRNDVEEAYSTMDVHMKKRYDLIPNLVETCKGYAKFESSTLEAVTRARSLAMNATGEAKANAEKELSSSLSTLMTFVREQYPELKANAQFMNLSRQLESIEGEIAQSRKWYNAKVKHFNNKIEMFPTSVVANKMRLERKPYFEIDEVERQSVKVDFSDSPQARL